MKLHVTLQFYTPSLVEGYSLAEIKRRITVITAQIDYLVFSSISSKARVKNVSRKQERVNTAGSVCSSFNRLHGFEANPF